MDKQVSKVISDLDAESIDQGQGPLKPWLRTRIQEIILAERKRCYAEQKPPVQMMLVPKCNKDITFTGGTIAAEYTFKCCLPHGHSGPCSIEAKPEG